MSSVRYLAGLAAWMVGRFVAAVTGRCRHCAAYEDRVEGGSGCYCGSCGRRVA